MNAQLYLISIIIFYTNTLFAQTNYGARLTAMGNNSAAVNDVWGVMANPASIAQTPSPMTQLTHRGHFFTNEIRNQAIAFVLPSKRLVFGLYLQRYGMSTFLDNKVGFIISKQFGPKLAIGLRTNYHQLNISNYGSTTGISVDLGTTYQLTGDLNFGFYIENPSKEAYNTKAIYTLLPTAVHFGIAYRTSDKLLIATTIRKDIIAIGIDYQLIKAFSIRSGLSLNPFTHYLGIGFNLLKLVVDFACIKHTNLGYSPQLTVGYVF